MNNSTSHQNHGSPAHFQRLKGDFHRWLMDWSTVTDSDRLLDELKHCPDPLPRDYCSQFDLPRGSTYRDAANLFSSSWADGTNDKHA